MFNTPAFALAACLLATACASTGSADQSVQSLDPAAHDFDFWLGDWKCYTTEGELGGTNNITSECGGLVLQEHWRDTDGGVGTSLNIYDAVTGLWHQTWVDQYGTLLQLDGGLDELGHMVMEGTRPRRDGGGTALHRITWTPENGTVRQVWTYSFDQGATWGTLADLVYEK